MRRPFFALLALLAAAAVGCGTTTPGTGSFKGAEGDVAQAVADLQTAGQKDETRRVCREILSSRITATLGARCEQTVHQAFQDADSTELGVDSVRITGQSARVRVLTGRKQEQKELVELVREGKSWKIDRFGGVVR
jgi:hypothetical protein